jgi:alkanesulfonate monooxygenase SsuD/methylene tetrahydromethanopterin reductase-like flavin-dependent oxidoreductase (luciferase family)
VEGVKMTAKLKLGGSGVHMPPIDLGQQTAIAYEQMGLDQAIVGLDAYAGTPPRIAVAGGPGKAMRYGATLADGWMIYLPPCGSAEQYAEHVTEFRVPAQDRVAACPRSGRVRLGVGE